MFTMPLRAAAVVAALMTSSLLAAEPSADMTQPVSPLTDAADPTAVRDGDYWYVYTTGEGILARRTKDFVTWEVLPTVFKQAVPKWAKERIPQAFNIWAPDINKIGDRYHLLYHVSFWGSQKSVMGVATAKTLDPNSPDYGWTDEGLLIDSDPARGDDFNAIDGSIALDKDGKPWLVWGSYWTGVKITKLDDKTGKVIDVKDRASIASAGHGPEGAQVIYRDGWYYLLMSFEGGPNYHVVVGRSKDIKGPYLDQNGVNLTQGGGTRLTQPAPGLAGPGHHGLALGDERFGDLLLCHVFNRFSRDLYVADMMWTKDGWPVIGEAYKPAGPKIQDIKAHAIATRWVMAINGGHIGSDNYRWLTLNPDGTAETVTASSHKQQCTWSIDGNELTLKWADANAPGGAWLDTVVIAADGSHFAGRNQNGVDVRGVPASLAEWKPK